LNPIAANLTAVKARVAAACERSGRDADSVRLLPVSKTRKVAEILRARSFGLNRFGENRAQELRDKAAELADTDIEWVAIGHLQLNKARIVAETAAEFQALDSLELAAALDRRLQALGRPLDVLIQVNSSAEPTKFGLPPSEVEGFAAALTPFTALRVRGLMTIAAHTSERERVAECFQLMRGVQDRLRQRALPEQSYDELSMGMSSDFETAIEHGATIVRIGEAIFGPRGE
jgi:pyridoxal phosphate enzyme (YggS family)